MSKRLAREAAMCLLYEREMNGEPGELETLFEMRDILKSDKFTPEQNEYINEIVKKFEENAIYIDSVISKYNKDGWKIDRIGRVDLSILSLALIEIFYMDDMPFKVTANEAVELAI